MFLSADLGVDYTHFRYYKCSPTNVLKGVWKYWIIGPDSKMANFNNLNTLEFYLILHFIVWSFVEMTVWFRKIVLFINSWKNCSFLFLNVKTILSPVSLTTLDFLWFFRMILQIIENLSQWLYTRLMGKKFITQVCVLAKHFIYMIKMKNDKFM